MRTRTLTCQHSSFALPHRVLRAALGSRLGSLSHCHSRADDRPGEDEASSTSVCGRVPEEDIKSPSLWMRNCQTMKKSEGVLVAHWLPMNSSAAYASTLSRCGQVTSKFHIGTSVCVWRQIRCSKGPSSLVQNAEMRGGMKAGWSLILLACLHSVAKSIASGPQSPKDDRLERLVEHLERVSMAFLLTSEQRPLTVC